MYNVEKFLKTNESVIRKNCIDSVVADKVIEAAKEIRVALESQFLEKLKSIFIENKIDYTKFKLLVDSYNINDIDLYEKWFYDSIS